MSLNKKKKSSSTKSETRPVYQAPVVRCVSTDLLKNKQLEINACNSGFGSGPAKNSDDEDSVSY